MKRIDTIHLKNFKAFRDQTFDLGGKNVLIYGNNGSGKSSLFWAIYTFFQSSGKDNTEIAKYFLKFDDTKPETWQSLRNIFANETDEAFIKMKWLDANSGESDENLISKDTINTNWSPKGDAIRDADLGSDFINYKLLHNFFNTTHKTDTNLWEVFMRDIFPFFQPDYSQSDFRKEIGHYLSGVPGTEKRVSTGGRKEAFNRGIEQLNLAIETFVDMVANAANDYIHDNALEGERKIEINLKYLDRINYEDIRWKRSSPKIRLTLKIWDTDTNDWKVVMRPHSYLNEALLTRITIAIRFGALLTRIRDTDFKVLCLDDMLISLDMSNRMQIVRRLLDAGKNPYKDYQIVMLTHDKSFYQIVKHQIGVRQVEKMNADGMSIGAPMENDWYFWEFYNDEYHNLEQPYVATGDGDLELAEKFFKSFQFAACANHLRKECERRIKIFLPEHKWYEVHHASGDIRMKTLEHLLDELNKYHGIHNKDFAPFANLKLYKDILMNPLSHDNYGTSVFQAELREIMDDLIPKLGQLKNEILYEVERGKEKILHLKITDDEGVEWIYRVQILEHFRRITFLDGQPVFSKTACKVIEGTNAEGKTRSLMNSYSSLVKAYARICKIRSITSPPDLLQAITTP